MLKLEKINVVLGEGSQLRRHIIRDFSLKVDPGEFVIIIGSNGAGKSTLFNAISGTVKLKTGKIKVIGSGLQSGSNRILKLMNRKYLVEDYRKAINALKAMHPGINHIYVI